jgi:hypothetical protein
MAQLVGDEPTKPQLASCLVEVTPPEAPDAQHFPTNAGEDEVLRVHTRDVLHECIAQEPRERD